MRTKFVQYYVEGEDEEKLIQTLKNDLGIIRSGKVQKLNVIDHILSDARLYLKSSLSRKFLIWKTSWYIAVT